MNWTGGRLKRHAKHHNSSEVKAQRRFFAQVSRKSTTTSYYRRGALLQQSEHPNSITQLPPHRQHCLSDKRSLPKSRAQFLQGVLGDSRTSEKYITDAALLAGYSTISNTQPTCHDKDDQYCGIQSGRKHGDIDREVSSMPDPSHRIEEMKKILLDQPDWLGLSACRPASINFVTPEETTSIGRHRRSMLRRNRDPTTRPSHPRSLQEAPRTTLGKRKRSDQEADSSFRNSYKRPSDVAKSPGNVVPHSGSVVTHPRSSLGVCRIDGERNDICPSLVVADDNRIYYELAPNYTDDILEDLIPLDEVRELQNFDQVRDKYASEKQRQGQGTDHNAESSTKHSGSSPLVQHTISSRDGRTSYVTERGKSKQVPTTITLNHSRALSRGNGVSIVDERKQNTTPFGSGSRDEGERSSNLAACTDISSSPLRRSSKVERHISQDFHHSTLHVLQNDHCADLPTDSMSAIPLRFNNVELTNAQDRIACTNPWLRSIREQPMPSRRHAQFRLDDEFDVSNDNNFQSRHIYLTDELTDTTVSDSLHSLATFQHVSSSNDPAQRLESGDTTIPPLLRPIRTSYPHNAWPYSENMDHASQQFHGGRRQESLGAFNGSRNVDSRKTTTEHLSMTSASLRSTTQLTPVKYAEPRYHSSSSIMKGHRDTPRAIFSTPPKQLGPTTSRHSGTFPIDYLETSA